MASMYWPPPFLPRPPPLPSSKSPPPPHRITRRKISAASGAHLLQKIRWVRHLERKDRRARLTDRNASASANGAGCAREREKGGGDQGLCVEEVDLEDGEVGDDVLAAVRKIAPNNLPTIRTARNPTQPRKWKATTPYGHVRARCEQDARTSEGQCALTIGRVCASVRWAVCVCVLHGVLGGSHRPWQPLEPAGAGRADRSPAYIAHTVNPPHSPLIRTPLRLR